MTTRSRFFDSTAGDRVYNADAMAEVVYALTGDGVVDNRGVEMAVSEDSPASMNVHVGLGAIFVRGRFLEVYGASEELAVGAAHATLPRIDRVVVRRDLAARTMTLAVKAGTAAGSPTPPALTQVDAGVWEVSLAQVAVAAAATSIVNANITDERGVRAQSPSLAGELLGATGHRHEGIDGSGRAVRYTDLTSRAHAIGGADHTGTLANDHARAHDHSVAADGTTLKPNKFVGVVAAASVTANQNNYNPAGFSDCTILRLSPTADRSITGFVAQEPGRVILVYNAALGPSQSINLKTESTSSTAANRITMEQNLVGTLTIAPRSGTFMVYDGTLARWVVLGYNIFNSVP
jgi:hypothetical protein